MKRIQHIFLLLLAMTVACTPLGAVMYKLAPDPVTDAKYKLKDRPTVILVENFRNPDLAEIDAELLTRDLSEKLAAYEEDKKKIVQIVPYEKVLELRNERPKDFAAMTIPQIGKAVGAEQVIYVDLQANGVAPMATGEVLQGKAAAVVKVVDVDTGETLWPIEMSEGCPVTAQTNPLQGQEPGTLNAVRAELYDTLAEQITNLFHKYSVNIDHPSSMGTD